MGIILIMVGATAQLSQIAEDLQIAQLVKEYNSKSQSIPPHEPEGVAGPYEPAARRLDGDQINELISRYQAGEPIAQLSRDLGIHRSTLYVRLERAGIELRQRDALSPTQIQEAARLYERGESLSTVGRVFGVDAQTVRHHLAKAGVEIRKRKGW